MTAGRLAISGTIVYGMLAAASMAHAGVAGVAGDNTKAPIRFAVLGDSDSSAYQDGYSFPPDSTARGGAYRPFTLQWTEVLTRMRPAYLDMGPWGLWGQRRPVAMLQDWLGLPSRSPRKQDNLYNLAASGAVCDDLMLGVFRQAPRLADMIRREPDAWRNAVVVIRMGVNDIGNHTLLERMVSDPNAPEVIARSDNCAQRVDQAIQLLRAVQPSLRIAIVGPFNETDDPYNRENWHSALAQANLRKGFSFLLNNFRQLSSKYPGVHFVEDWVWFRARWGGRNADGVPNYKTVRIGDFLEVTNSVGDAPNNSVLSDDHSGLVYNTLWAQGLVDELNSTWNLEIPPITDTDIASFICRILKR